MFKIFGKELEATKGKLEALSQVENEHLQELGELKATLAQRDSQLGATQKELKALSLELTSIKKQSSSEIDSKAKVIVKLEKDLEKLSKEKTTLVVDVTKAQDDAKTLNKKLQAQEKQSIGDLSVKDKVIAKLEKDLEKLTKEKSSLTTDLATMKEARDKARSDNALNYENFVKVKASRDKALEENKTNFANFEKAKLARDRFKLRIKDMSAEKDLLLMQLHQLKEDSAQYFAENERLQQINKALSAKQSRIIERMPNYVDFGGLSIVSVDASSDIPQVVWKVTDFSKANIILSEFYFSTTMQDGLPGIALLDSPNQKIDQNTLFIPGTITKSAPQVEIFRNFSALEWQQIYAATTVLEQLIVSKTPDKVVNLNGVENFDLSFWKNSFQNLIVDIRKLPPVMRYNQIKLKREVQNPDYEHLWIEFYGVEFGDYQKPKLELRIGASLIEANGFSKYPKFELPLIDGKHKPFESWFPESRDDYGNKFELRFSLEKQVFDIGTWQKLAEADRRVLQALLFSLPAALTKLANNKISIIRPWSVWIDFVKSSLLVMQKQAGVIPKEVSKMAPAPATVKAAIPLEANRRMPAVERRANPRSAPASSPKTNGKKSQVTVLTVDTELGRRRSDQLQPVATKRVVAKKSSTAKATAKASLSSKKLVASSS